MATLCDSILLCSPCMLLIFVMCLCSFLPFSPHCYFCHCMTELLHRDQYNVMISHIKCRQGARQWSKKTVRCRQMVELTGRDKDDVDKKGSEDKRAMISWRCWSSTNMTPADVTPFEAAHHPPGALWKTDSSADSPSCPKATLIYRVVLLRGQGGMENRLPCFSSTRTVCAH